MGIGKLVRWSASLAILFALGTSAHAESKRYLVKFKSPETFRAMSVKFSSASSLATQSSSSSLSQMSLFGANAAVTEALDHVQLMVIESADGKAIESLKNHPAIAFVEEEVMHPAPKPVATFGSSASHVVDIQRSRSGPIPTPWGITAVRAPQAWSVTRGENSRVMVLDTGVDTGHVALASRIEKTRNLMGGGTDVTDTVGHGTHVAGTILADGVSGGLVGVAPAAKLLMGKVCGDQGCSSVSIAQGINWGVSEGVDVISMSLGGMFITPGETQALDAAEAAGVSVVAASGNDGSARVSYPAAYKTCISVGAIDENNQKADFSQYGPELTIVAPGVEVYSAVPRGSGRESFSEIDFADGKGSNDVGTAPMQGSPLGTLNNIEAVDAGLGKTTDFANISVRGKLALISRGEITFKEKIANAIKAGAIGAIVYNNAPGLIQGALTDDGSEVAIPAVMIEQAPGLKAKAALAQGQMVKGSLSVQKADFSNLQGTSMATPHVAGVVALIKSANPKLKPAEIKALLKRTATALGPNNQNQYGAGLVNAEKAVSQAINALPPVLGLAN